MQLKGMKIIVRRARRLRRTTHEVPRVGVREPRPSRRKSANSQYHGITSPRARQEAPVRSALVS